MAGMTCWPFSIKEHFSDSSGLAWGAVLRSQHWHPIVPAPRQGPPGVPFVLRQESFQDALTQLPRVLTCPPSLQRSGFVFPSLPAGFSCGHFMGCEESEWIYVRDDSVSTNTLQSILPLPYFISGLPLSWVEVCGDPRATTGQDNNFFRGVSSTTLFHVWTLIAHDHQVSMGQETLHINCCFTYIWLFVFPVVFPRTAFISYLRVRLPWIFVSFNTCSMDHWVSRHSVPPYY